MARVRSQGLSVWSLTAGAIQQLGKPLPDVTEIFKHVAGSVGGEKFGIPRIPESHRPGDLPLNYLKAVWPAVLPVARRFCDEPGDLPVLFGLALQDAIIMGRDVIDATLAGQIAMECAIPMSKFDLAGRLIAAPSVRREQSGLRHLARPPRPAAERRFPPHAH